MRDERLAGLIRRSAQDAERVLLGWDASSGVPLTEEETLEAYHPVQPAPRTERYCGRTKMSKL